MADQPGFFEKLIGSPVDETRVADMQQAEQRKAAGNSRFQNFYNLGEQAGSGLGKAGASLLGKGQQARDNETAAANGIQVEEVIARRRIRQETAKVTDDGSFPARRKMAEIAARISNEEGDSSGLARALDMMQSLKNEEAEFNKLNAGVASAEAKAVDDATVNGFTSEGRPRTGVLAIENGQSGMKVTEGGELIFKPFDEDFSMVDPERTENFVDPFTIANEIKKNNGVAFVGRVKGLASSANTALAKTDRVLSTLTDLFENGGVESVIGTSGRIITGIDNLVRNINGVINTFSSRGQAADSKPGQLPNGEERTWAGRVGLVDMAQDASNGFSQLIQLPEGVSATSAAAQQHRAAVMEMAYMAARLAEPSNRGLSDNDIKNALARIAGDTSNPQVMMRRFLEMQVDAAHELDFELRLLHGSLGPGVSDEQINTAMVGKGYAEYKQRKDELFKKFKVSVNADGRAIFEEGTQIGIDVQPGQGVDDVTAVADPTEQMSDEELLATFSTPVEEVPATQ